MRTSTVSPLVFLRPSRHDGPLHVVVCDPSTLRPSHCSCLAGQHGRLCWAVIDVAATELVPVARQRWLEACGIDEIAAAAHVLAQTRKWAAAALELQALRGEPTPAPVIA